MSRIYKKDLYKAITQLNVDELSELSKQTKYINFQRGSKTFLRTLIKDATTQEELAYLEEYISTLKQHQDLGVWGLIQQYKEQGDVFRVAYYFLNESGLTDTQILKFFETYETTLYALRTSEEVEQLVDEYKLMEIEIDELRGLNSDEI